MAVKSLLRSSSIGSQVQLQFVSMAFGSVLGSALQLRSSAVRSSVRWQVLAVPRFVSSIQLCSSASLQLGVKRSCNSCQHLSFPSPARLCSSAALQLGTRCSCSCWRGFGLSVQFNFAAPQLLSLEPGAVAVNARVCLFRPRPRAVQPQLLPGPRLVSSIQLNQSE